MEGYIVWFKSVVDDFMYAIWNRDLFSLMEAYVSARRIYLSTCNSIDETYHTVLSKVVDEELIIVELLKAYKSGCVIDLYSEFKIDAETYRLDKEILPKFDEIYEKVVSAEVRRINIDTRC